MKVSIGYKVIDGPWGGGNNFRINLDKYLTEKGIQVTNNLNDRDLDIIILTEPRLSSFSSSYTFREIYYYKKLVNPNVKVIHRINECDERKNTNFINKLLKKANIVADHTVFVSAWLRNIHLANSIGLNSSSVILSGADNTIFNNEGKVRWNKVENLKIVTHHWGNDWNKGFKIYSELDKIIDKQKNFKFTYIGNLPNNFKFKNTNYLEPLSGLDLSNELKSHHLYLTASLNEPSGNHHIEAAQCGLPIMFINSGGIVEYCADYGLMFEDSNFYEKLLFMVENYDKFFDKVKNYSLSSESTNKQFLELFYKLTKENSKKTLNFVNFRIRLFQIVLFYYKVLKFIYIKLNAKN